MQQNYEIIKIVQATITNFYKNKEKEFSEQKPLIKCDAVHIFEVWWKSFEIVKHTFVSRNKPNPFLQVFLWMNEKHNQSKFLVTHE